MYVCIYIYTYTSWCPPVISWFITIVSMSMYHDIPSTTVKLEFFQRTNLAKTNWGTPIARFTDEDLDPIDLGGLIHWTPPLALRRVAWYVVDLAVDAAGPLEAQQRSQIGTGGPWEGMGMCIPS